jgi:DUF1365 family protein
MFGQAASLYFGKVMHARLKPKSHRFSYSIFSLAIDLDQLPKANTLSSLFSVNGHNVFSFFEKDHGNRDGSSLRNHVDELLKQGGMAAPDRIVLWCNPRLFGYTFNPLSVFFCYDENDEVFALIYQVHNTFGEAHSYVAGIDYDMQTSGSIRQSADKCFYVSPFLDMDLKYNFRVNPPNETLKIRILEQDDKGPILSATFAGTYRELSTGNLLLGMIKTAGLTWKVMAGIHYEALFLWVKGITIRPRPAPPETPSFITDQDRS